MSNPAFQNMYVLPITRIDMYVKKNCFDFSATSMFQSQMGGEGVGRGVGRGEGGGGGGGGGGPLGGINISEMMYDSINVFKSIHLFDILLCVGPN